MKILVGLLATFGLMGITLADVKTFAANDPVKIPAFYEKAYVPEGFDSNDQVEFVGEGLFSNTCYRPAETNVSVNHEKKTILVGPAAYQYAGFCLQVILPFDRVINAGLLKPGTYQVIQEINGAQLGQVNVKEAKTESADEFLYAPISQAFFRNSGMTSEIYLTGEFKNSCLSLDKVAVSVQKDVIVVQPIAKIDDNGNCQEGRFHFEELVKIDTLRKGRYLLHVRSMNAKSVNSLVDVK